MVCVFFIYKIDILSKHIMNETSPRNKYRVDRLLGFVFIIEDYIFNILVN
jgi:hypothetical protein